MAGTSLDTLKQQRDNINEVITALSQEGVTSYSIGDQTFSLVDLEKLMNMRDRLDRQIATKERTLGPAGSNRADFRQLNYR